MSESKRPYSESYLQEVMETQGKFFECLQDEPEPIDSEDMITAYLNSDTRRQLDEGHAYYLTLNADDLKRVFLEESGYQPKSGEPLRGFMPNWIGQFYAYAQWKWGVLSREIIRKLPVRTMRIAYPGIHDLDMSLAVERTEKWCKRGSALLIVLGMLAFMVVSAVSFSMFMRQSRVPSSYLRRTASSRYLLKAALANAIARIDGQLATEAQIGNNNLGDSTTSGYCEGVYDDPYPGIGPSQVNDNDADHRKNGGYFEKRVFCPFGLLGTKKDSNGVPHYQTVSTLTLEGLAYLPPAIINEVRVYSRLTRTAKWRNLAYDAGRYAFCAVDVSDCFDINRMSAGGRRSSAPGERVNLSSLFPNNGTQLDNILKQCSNFWTPGGNNIPFTSVADFNIVAQGTSFSPFGQAINAGNDLEQHIQKQDQTVANALFITDTYFPPTNRVDDWTRYDISLDATASEKKIGKMTLRTGQPFKTYVDDAGILDALPKSGDKSLGPMLVNHIGAFGMLCLYDYLDKDHRPLSLCMPCTEAVPMVCGIGLAHGGNIKPKAKDVLTLNGTYDVKVSEEEIKKYHRKATKYAMTSFGGKIQIVGTCMLPFRRLKDKQYPTSFTGEALVKAWWALESCDSRLPKNTTPIKIDSDSDWNDSVKEGIITIKQDIPNLGLTIKDEPETKEAMGKFNALIEFPNVEMPLFWYVEETDDLGNAIPDGKYYSLDGIGGNADALIARGTDGDVDEWWADIVKKGVGPDPTDPTIFNNGVWSDGFKHKNTGTQLNNRNYVMHIAVWIKIKDGDGKVVDLVPARLEDDQIWNNKNGSLPTGEFDALIGDQVPILEFRCLDCPFTYDVGVPTALDGNKEERFTKTWDSIFCADPRFNWAPENWFVEKNGGDMSEGIWITKFGADGSTSGVFSRNDRDHDIFMFTSDQEELQSIGELQFLPFVGWVNGSGGSISQAFANELASGGYNGASMGNRTKWEDCACANMFWKSYSPFEDPLYEPEQNVEVVSSSGDFRVNPFSPDTRVLMAALKDTPYDYYVASPTEDSSLNKFVGLNAKDFQEHAFNAQGSVAIIKDEVMDELAGELQKSFQQQANNGNFDWVKAYNQLAWFDGTTAGNQQLHFLGVKLDDPLYGVDRKFLYSFWRECFQNRQQLFLVFVRAEPLTVGGAGEGSLASAQLGARGVALVWRDPQPPARGTRPPRTNLTNPSAFEQLFNNSGPHQTRVLFYHQFD